MTLFVFVSNKCAEDAQTHGLVEEIEKFRGEVSSTQSTSVFDRFPQPYLVKEKLGGRQGRLIAEQRFVAKRGRIQFP